MMSEDHNSEAEVPENGFDSDALIANSPLREVPPDAIEELLARINEDLLAGTPEKITDDDPRMKKIISIYRAEAENWAIQASAPKKPRGAPREPKIPAAKVVGVVELLDEDM